MRIDSSYTSPKVASNVITRSKFMETDKHRLTIFISNNEQNHCKRQRSTSIGVRNQYCRIEGKKTKIIGVGVGLENRVRLGCHLRRWHTMKSSVAYYVQCQLISLMLVLWNPFIASSTFLSLCTYLWRIS